MSCCDNGFRLPTASECSLRSKARIDALFEDSRSVCSSLASRGWSGATIFDAGCCSDEDQQRRVNSAVQARIEAMFASVEAESAAPGECAAALLPVEYMGAAPVGGRVASVRGLQEPLRQLVERIRGAVSAELEVSRRGLTFRTSELHEKNNPFRRIAVWSALKLQARKRQNLNSDGFVHAFVPLVADERVYETAGNASTGNSEDRHAELYRTMRGLSRPVDEYPPIFAVVMRQPGAARLLECHAFACRCEEDAIAAAATLYRALLADLDATARRPRQKNGLGCASLASVASSLPTERPAPPPPPPQPVRPPRPKRASRSSSSSSSSNSSNLNPRDDQSCSSLCMSLDVSDKLPWRKKMNSDVKAEDVLEARSRRFCPAAKPAEQATREEKRVNAKDRIYGCQGGERQAMSGEAQVIEKVYDERSGSSCELENSLYESSRMYAKARAAGQKVPNESRAFEESRPQSSSTPSHKSTTDSSCLGQLENGSSGQPRRADGEASYAEQRRRNPPTTSSSSTSTSSSSSSSSSSNSSASSVARHREQFRDAEKIYSFGPGEVSGAADVAKPNRPTAKTARASDSSTKRLARVATMDRPLRRLSLESPPRPQQATRVPRRSRAGSEPPSTRTEAAAAAATAAMLKRSQSDVDLDRGDLLTRVELPRRSSFLKPNSVRKRDGREGTGAGTPLGFSELFDEFRNQEGLTSVDDILAAIIDPEGMSFNELKPLYKEFLLKLAATLTQDELYQRSASIMRRRRRPQRRRSSSRGLLRRAIKRSVSRLRSSGGAPTEFTSVIFPARRLNERSSFASSSSCDAAKAQTSGASALASSSLSSSHHQQHQRGNPRVLAGKLSNRRRSASGPTKSRVGHTTSEDSDTCRRIDRDRLVAVANRSSSGYVSCSECSYDSESCTCVSADKCYCSLSCRPSAQPEAAEPPALICSCDSDSCSESNKCYCAKKPAQQQPSILEQLRQKGIVPSESTLSRSNSPERLRRASRRLTTSKSLEYLKVRGSTDNLALDYDLFRPGGRRSSRCSSGSEKVLVVSARDPQGRLIYVGGSSGGRDGQRSSRHGQADRRQHGSSATDGHHEALSIKKSAEIAAVFGAGLHARLPRRTSSASSLRSSVSLEAGLGYLP